jgi:hypothetical protein
MSKREIEEKTGIIDLVEFVHYDKNGKVINRYNSKQKGLFHRLLVKLHIRKPQCLTNAAFAALSAMILLDVGGVTAWDFMALGTGTTGSGDPTVSALVTEINRKAAVGTQQTTTVTNDTAQWQATFSSADGLSGISNVTEIGIFNLATLGGTMLMRQVFSAEIMNWDAGDSIQFTVKVQMKQGS